MRRSVLQIFRLFANPIFNFNGVQMLLLFGPGTGEDIHPFFFFFPCRF